jgi:hypothetical protein
MKASAAANQRKRRALAVLKKNKLNAIPKSVTMITFRDPTSAERAHGRSLTRRATELLARKSRKLAVSH